MRYAHLIHPSLAVGVISAILGAVVAYAAPSKTNYDPKVIACRDAVLNRLDPDDRRMEAIAIRKQLYYADRTIYMYINVQTSHYQTQAICVWSDEHRKVLRVFGMEGLTA